MSSIAERIVVDHTGSSGLQTSHAHDFPRWQNLVSESFVPLAVTTDRPEGFHGRLKSRVLDGVSLVEVTASGHEVLRTPALICRADRMYFKLSLQIAGSGLLIQDGREATLAPGDLAVYDTHRPYSLVFDNDFRSMVLMFPHDLIDLPADAVGQLTAVRMNGSDGLGKVISPFLIQLAENLDELSGPSGQRLAHNALDLVTTMFAAELSLKRQGVNDLQRDLVATMLRFIEKHLGDPELSPATVAAAHFISTRHLHNLFQSEGMTVASWIRTRRLEHCRRDLHDPVFRDRSVASIAARWGFVDAAHFSRVFRAAFGDSPSQYRNRPVAQA